MSSERISQLLYLISALIGVLAALLNIDITIPIIFSGLLGAIAGYLLEKQMQRKRYDEPWPFKLHRLDLWGALGGIFFNVVAYQITVWIIE